jgi:DNA-directed RNA polymerase specialized sigma24 family protein
MRKVKEVLRLRFELGFGQRQIARSCGMGLSTVHGRWRPGWDGLCRKG